MQSLLIKIGLGILLGTCLSSRAAISTSGGITTEPPRAAAERQDYLERVNQELNFWEDIIRREGKEYERGGGGDERDKVLQDLELLARDIRGQLLKLGPATREVWDQNYKLVEGQLAELRSGFANLP